MAPIHHPVIVSPSHDPFFNLSLEHLLFEQLTQPCLFLYVNAPCVVIGRAQNPWQEANLAFLQEHAMPLLRRQSGGGTVVHDGGNLNFCFLSPRAQYDKSQHLQWIIEALSDFGIRPTMTPHYDLMLSTEKGLAKCSGSAFRESKERCFHHGTLLIHSDLAMLKKALDVPPRTIVSKAIPSRRSPVINLTHHHPSLTIARVIESLSAVFCKAQGQPHRQWTSINADFTSPELELTRARYTSLEWIYGHTLPFQETITLKGYSLTLNVEKACIVDYTPSLPEFSFLVGLPYWELTLI